MATTTLALRKEVNATLKRLEKKDPGLKRLLDKAHAYAVFPAVGKAALIVGGAYGKGLVFEKGQPIGHATIGQTTIGVQVGGDTFAEVVVFDSKEPLERFKKGKLAFAASASAVLVKAGAAATADFEKGVAVFAYPQGGMLLEAAIGGQKFKFKPMGEQAGGQSAQGKSPSRQQSSDEEGQEDEDGGEEGEGSGEGQDDGQSRGLLGRTAGGIGSAASKVTGLVKEHPVAAALIGVGVIGALYAVRAMRSSSAGDSAGSEEDQDSGEEDQQDQGEEDYGEEDESDEQQDSEAEDSGEDQSEEGDQGEDEQDPEPVRRRGRSRA